jgi:hypothetical protein
MPVLSVTFSALDGAFQGENGQALLATMIGKFSCEIGRSMN